MIVLIANLGSTSFKYKLFDMPSEKVLAVGACDRIGLGDSAWDVTANAQSHNGTADLPDHAAAVDLHLHKLVELGAIASIDAVEAIGFKAVHGGPISGAVRVTDDVLQTMQRFVPLAPAHNPPYIEAMKSFREKLPGVEQVAAFETAFHQTIPLARQVYAIPHEWIEQHGIRRYGFHGASHRYISERLATLVGPTHNSVSLHLGGSCSICAIDSGDSVANSFGTSAQTGVFHNNRVGDFDAFAVPALEAAGLDRDEIYRRLGKESGLLGLSGVSSDLREVEAAAARGDDRAKLAIDAFVESCRHYLGAYLAVLNGADALAFTGGIGQHGHAIREAICDNLDFAGIMLDPLKNESADGRKESRIDHADSKTRIYIIPTNEELIVARQTVDVLAKQAA